MKDIIIKEIIKQDEETIKILDDKINKLINMRNQLERDLEELKK
jgi:hypothetical protein